MMIHVDDDDNNDKKKKNYNNNNIYQHCNHLNVIVFTDESDGGVQPETEQQPVYQDSQTQTQQSGFSAQDHRSEDSIFHKLTGLVSYKNFKMVFCSFGDAIIDMTYYYGWTPTMELEDQFF
jgi:hypothetical protein